MSPILSVKPQKTFDIVENMTRMLKKALQEECPNNWPVSRLSKTSYTNKYERYIYEKTSLVEEYLQSIGQEIMYAETTDQYQGFYLKLWLTKQYVIGTFVDYPENYNTEDEEFVKDESRNPLQQKKWQLNEIYHEGPIDNWPHFSKHTEATIYGIEENVTLTEALKTFNDHYRCTSHSQQD